MSNLDKSYKQAIDAVGLPSVKQEAWRYANLKGLQDIDSLANSVALQAPRVSGQFAAKLVFVNGTLDQDQSDFGPLAVGAIAAESFSHDVAILNEKLVSEATGVVVPESLDSAILIQHLVSGAPNKATATQVRIKLAEGVQADLHEQFRGDAGAHWSNTVTTIKASKGAAMTHTRTIVGAGDSTVMAAVYVTLQEHARYRGFNVLAGGQMIRNESHIEIQGTGAHGQSDTIAFTETGATHDTYTTVNHAVPEATSDQLYRSVIAKKGSAAFQGKVIVAKDAQLTNADQNCRAILLDRTAEANAKPELEIFADDVKCTHGATVGELDQKAYFYCLTRGMSPSAARRVLMEAFVAEMFERIENEDLRETIATLSYAVLEGLADD